MSVECVTFVWVQTHVYFAVSTATVVWCIEGQQMENISNQYQPLTRRVTVATQLGVYMPVSPGHTYDFDMSIGTDFGTDINR